MFFFSDGGDPFSNVGVSEHHEVTLVITTETASTSAAGASATAPDVAPATAPNVAVTEPVVTVDAHSHDDSVNVQPRDEVSIQELAKLPLAEVQTIMQSNFGSYEYVHSYLTCQSSDCDKFHDEMTAVKENWDKFKHGWLSKKYWWACFIEEIKGTYCLLCMKHKSKSSLNKEKNTFIETPSTRFKFNAIKNHHGSGIHLQSCQNELLQRAKHQ